jgi:hypothetical protein
MSRKASLDRTGFDAVTVPVTAVIGDRDQVEHEAALQETKPSSRFNLSQHLALTGISGSGVEA